MLPFLVPTALCRGRGLLAFWIVTVLYHLLLGSLAVLFLRVTVKEAAIFLSSACLIYGRRPEPGTHLIDGDRGGFEGLGDADIPSVPIDGPFLAAVIANPNDHSLRLVYADYLEERGDPWGGILRLQCVLATKEADDPRRPGLEARRKELLTRHGEAWLGPLLRRYLEEHDEPRPAMREVRQLAEIHRVLPVTFGLDGFFAVGMDGEVVRCGWSRPDGPPRTEQDPIMRHAALLHGAAKFPVLRLLLPPRPLQGRDCTSCGGRTTNRPRLPGLGCICGGLGWVPPAYGESNSHATEEIRHVH